MNRAAHDSGRVAAFFDVDGTLVAHPSLERQFYSALRRRRAMPIANYLRWLAHTMRLAPQGIAAITNANKVYLRNVSVAYLDSCAPAPRFLPGALARVAWHASQQHPIVLVSGTLAPLAHRVALSLTVHLAAHGFSPSIGVCATQIEEAQDLWTGRILGDAMYGEAKARAMRQIAAGEGFDLGRCYAYGDSATDRWMLAAVGRPVAVNPSPDLARIARLHEWPVMLWPARTNRPGADGDLTSPCARIAIEKFDTPGMTP